MDNTINTNEVQPQAQNAKSKNNFNIKEQTVAIVSLILGVIALALSFFPQIFASVETIATIAIVFAMICMLKEKKILIPILAVLVSTCAFFAANFIEYRLEIDESEETIIINGETSGNKKSEKLSKEIKVSIGEFVIERFEDDSYSDSDNIESTYLPVSIKNLSEDTKNVSIVIEAVDDAGDRIAEEMIDVENLLAGQTKRDRIFSALTEEEALAIEEAEFKVLSISSLEE